MNEAAAEVLFNELFESDLFDCGKRIDRAEGGQSTVLKIDLVVIRAARRKGRSLDLAEDICEFVIRRRYLRRNISSLRCEGAFELRSGGVGGSGISLEGSGLDDAGKEDGLRMRLRESL